MPDDWKSELPDSLQQDPTIQNTKDVTGLAQQLVDSQAMIGRSVRMPGPDASEEARTAFYDDLVKVPGVVRLPADDDKDGWDAFHSKLGRPESPEEYKVARPEGTKLPDGFEKPYLDTLHAIGASQRQVDTFMSQLYEQAGAVNQQTDAAMADFKSAMTEKYGAGLDQYLDLADRAAASLGISDVIEEHGLNTDVQFANAMVTLGRILEEGGSALEDLQLDSSGSQYELTPDEANARINEIQNNKEHPYHDKRKPGHKEAVAEFLRLHEIKAAGAGAAVVAQPVLR